jgi:hypothetical protein
LRLFQFVKTLLGCGNKTKEMQLELNTGILIIGSLFWEGNENVDPKRRWHWRNEKLLMDEALHVKAPIRYGKKSEGDIYTMVFSKECEDAEKFGTAYVVPSKAQNLKIFEDLLQEAESLSKAEGPNDQKLVKGNRIKWCTIGLLFNPNFSHDKKEYILSRWSPLLIEHGQNANNCHSYRVGNEPTALSENGEILLQWPKVINTSKQEKLDKLDIILATCTKPNVNPYPQSKNLAENLSKDERCYFFSNCESGITTFQDREIIHLATTFQS